MHVLGAPPAFVLSQDQTLNLNSCSGEHKLLLCSSLNYSYYVTLRDYLKGPSSILLILFNFQGPYAAHYCRRNYILSQFPSFVNHFLKLFSKFFQRFSRRFSLRFQTAFLLSTHTPNLSTPFLRFF